MTLAINNVKNSTTEVSRAIEQTENHAGNSKSVIQKTIQSIMDLADNVHIAFDSITELQNQMGDIEGILNTITGISDQTNLLALNAAIEAARAGEAGRGFAVVAGEVRTLSQNTHAATNDIKNLIGQLQTSSSTTKQVIEKSQTEAGNTVTKAGESNNALVMISSAVKELTELSSNIASTTQQQSDVAHNLEGNIDKYLDTAEHSQQRAEKVSDTSANLHDLAVELQGLVMGLKVSEKGKLSIH
jgi:methyl-accepting chemotaxis protein